MIKVYDKENKELSTGSGFCIYKEDYILTNYHVIEGAYKIKIQTDDRQEYDITDIIIFNGKNDLALLKGDFKFSPLKVNSNTILKAGDSITAIGSPQGQLNTVSTGVISNADDDYQIRITAPISPGSSGGVLLNKYNQVIGITYATYNSDDSQNINYAINVKYADDLINRYNTNNYVILDEVDFKVHKNVTIISGQEQFNLKNSFKDNIQYYSVRDNNNFYIFTNLKARLEEALTETSWEIMYNLLNNNEKYEVINKIKEKNNGILYNIKSDCFTIPLSSWSVEDLILNLNVLENYKYAILLVSLSQCNTKEEQLQKINEFELSNGQKLFISCTLCEYDWNYLSSKDKDLLFQYVCSLVAENKNRKIILEMFGYEIEINDDDTITVYWD